MWNPDLAFRSCNEAPIPLYLENFEKEKLLHSIWKAVFWVLCSPHFQRHGFFFFFPLENLTRLSLFGCQSLTLYCHDLLTLISVLNVTLDLNDNMCYSFKAVQSVSVITRTQFSLNFHYVSLIWWMYVLLPYIHSPFLAFVFLGVTMIDYSVSWKLSLFSSEIKTRIFQPFSFLL